jgi:hypothetical protein
MSATKTGWLCSCPFASWLSAYSENGMPVLLGHKCQQKIRFKQEACSVLQEPSLYLEKIKGKGLK